MRAFFHIGTGLEVFTFRIQSKFVPLGYGCHELYYNPFL